MATTSESIDRPQDYHVFLSFRGSDTRTNFTAYLYEALKRASIRTFIDDEGLKRGEALNPQLEEAITRSDISIVIFSPGYASSRWCLDELVMILDRVRNFRHKIVPVFYEVDPSHVRHQTECFKTAFESHQERGEKLVKIKAWKKALTEAANLSGWHHITNEYEPKFIEKIVNDVNDKQLQGRKLVNVANTHLVGIDEQVKDVEAWLRDPTHDSMVFVLLGMGGIGKTTIADYVYTSYIKHFDGGCFIGKLCELFAASDGLHKTRSRFLSGLNHGQSQKWKYPDDIQKINQYLSIRSVLIVLDEVTDEEQQEELLRGLVFCKGSKIIITTRNDLRLPKAKVHKVKLLDENDALELFCSHAFREHNTFEPCIDRCKQIVRRCGNLPLALKILGRSVGETDTDQWEETLQNIEVLLEDADIANNVFKKEIQQYLKTTLRTRIHAGSSRVSYCESCNGFHSEDCRVFDSKSCNGFRNEACKASADCEGFRSEGCEGFRSEGCKASADCEVTDCEGFRSVGCKASTDCKVTDYEGFRSDGCNASADCEGFRSEGCKASANCEGFHSEGCKASAVKTARLPQTVKASAVKAAKAFAGFIKSIPVK